MDRPPSPIFDEGLQPAELNGTLEDTVEAATMHVQRNGATLLPRDQKATSSPFVSVAVACESETTVRSEGPRARARRLIGRLERATTALLLEVLGGCGAVWGCAEAFAVRDQHNNDEWRVLAASVGLLCLVRWVSIHCIRVPIGDEKEALASFLLVVLGGTGALWGCAEIAGLRLNYPTNCHDGSDGGNASSLDGFWAPGFVECRNTYHFWRWLCVIALPLFWLAHQLRLRVQQHPPATDSSCKRSRGCSGPFWAELLFSFVLEVLGGAGAVWGAAEVAYLRKGWGDPGFGQESFDAWRPIVVLVAAGWCMPAWIWQRCTPAQRKECCTKSYSTARVGSVASLSR